MADVGSRIHRHVYLSTDCPDLSDRWVSAELRLRRKLFSAIFGPVCSAAYAILLPT